MPSPRPADLGMKGFGAPRFLASPAETKEIPLGQFTANATKTVLGLIADVRMVVRAVKFAADAIPLDADGTMLVNVKIQSIADAAADSIVAGFDTEAVILAAKKGYDAVLAAETALNERTMEPGDVLFFELVNNSAAIDTNANVLAEVTMQRLEPINA